MQATLAVAELTPRCEQLQRGSLLMKDSEYRVELLAAEDRVGATTDPAQAGLPSAKGATELLTAVNADLRLLS